MHVPRELPLGHRDEYQPFHQLLYQAATLGEHPTVSERAVRPFEAPPFVAVATGVYGGAGWP